MEIKIILTEEEVKAAVIFYLEKEKGIKISRVTDIEFNIDKPDDLPFDSPFVTCHRIESIVKRYEEVF